MLALPVILQPTYPYIREITSEDLCRWRAAYKSDVQVIIGKGRVEVMAEWVDIPFMLSLTTAAIEKVIPIGFHSAQMAGSSPVLALRLRLRQ